MWRSCLWRDPVFLFADLTVTTIDSLSICTGESTTVNIDLANVAGLYGYQFQVSYDATKASASGAFVNSFFDMQPTRATNGSVPPGWGAVCSSWVACANSRRLKLRLDPSRQRLGTSWRRSRLRRAAPGAFSMAISNYVLSDHRRRGPGPQPGCRRSRSPCVGAGDREREGDVAGAARATTWIRAR